MAVMDTLGIAEELARDGVVSREQAERLARISAKTATETLATKHDLDRLRQDFETGLERLAKELVKWFAGILVAHGITVIGVTVALVKLL
jgi:hypothetical protein